MKARETQTKPPKTLRRSDAELLEGWAVDGDAGRIRNGAALPGWLQRVAYCVADGTLPNTSSLEHLLEIASHTKMSLTSVISGIPAIAVLLLVLSGTPMFSQDNGGMMHGMGMGQIPVMLPPHPAPARQRPTSEVAKRVFAALDTTFELPAEVSLTDLPETLMNVAEVPVLIEPRSLKMAQVEDTATLRLPAHQVPLRTSLRTALRALNLKAVVENDGLAIVPDMGALARSNVGTTNWINVSDKVATRLLAALDDEATLEVDGTPLVEVLTQLSEQHDVPIKVDVRALEQIGLSGDVPVHRISVSEVTLHSALDTMLRELDLRLTIRDEALLITTQESAEANLLTRVYWMDATGISNEFTSIMGIIETTMEPDTWEYMGGPSTMAPLVLKERAGLTVSATLDVHRQIEALFKVMRENHFGSDTEFSVDVPEASPEEAPQGMMGGGMM